MLKEIVFGQYSIATSVLMSDEFVLLVGQCFVSCFKWRIITMNEAKTNCIDCSNQCTGRGKGLL